MPSPVLTSKLIDRLGYLRFAMIFAAVSALCAGVNPMNASISRASEPDASVETSLTGHISIIDSYQAVPSASQQTPSPVSSGKEQTKPTKSTDGRPKSGIRLKTDAEALREEKKQRALTMLDGVLLNADNISAAEYRILTQVEAATVLWPIERERALAILKRSVGSLQRLLEEKKESTETKSNHKSPEQMMWFLVIRKIAALQPDLAQQLLIKGESDTKPDAGMKDVWTEEARAVLSVASELTDKDPKLAARTAEQALSLGLASYMSFLRKLANRDNAEAERFSMIIIDRLSTDSFSPIHLRNLSTFMLSGERTVRLRNHYCERLSARLRMELRPETTPMDLADALGVANTMTREAGRDSAYWKEQFEGISLSIATMFKERSLALPIPPERISIDTTVSLAPAASGDTEPIHTALLAVGSIPDRNARNREFQKLAVRAANLADKSLAEEIISRIPDEDLRHETATMVYSPLVRASLKDSLWTRSQQLASLIVDPLARTLVFIEIAREMTKAGVDRFSIIDHYGIATRKLYRDDPSDRVAKAYLLLAKPLLEVDRDRGIDAIRSCAQTLSRISSPTQPLKESPIGSAASTWIRYSDPALLAEEVLNLPELVTGMFASVAQKDPANALEIAEWIEHRGMYSLAQLAAIKVLLKEATHGAGGTQRKEKAAASRPN